jgi:hypothetical protein
MGVQRGHHLIHGDRQAATLFSAQLHQPVVAVAVVAVVVSRQLVNLVDLAAVEVMAVLLAVQVIPPQLRHLKATMARVAS